MSPMQRSRLPIRSLAIRYLVALVTVGALSTGVELQGAQAAQIPPASEIDAIFAEYDMPGSVGCAFGVSLDGERVYKKGYGFANLDWDIPITSTTVFYTGSIPKQFTAASIALLVDE